MSLNFRSTNSLFVEFTGQIVKESVELSEAFAFIVYYIQALLFFRTGMTPMILYSITAAFNFLWMTLTVENTQLTAVVVFFGTA